MIQWFASVPLDVATSMLEVLKAVVKDRKDNAAIPTITPVRRRKRKKRVEPKPEPDVRADREEMTS